MKDEDWVNEENTRKKKNQLFFPVRYIVYVKYSINTISYHADQGKNKIKLLLKKSL